MKKSRNSRRRIRKLTLIRWYDHRYFALRYGAKEAEPLNMTLAKWKTINND